MIILRKTSQRLAIRVLSASAVIFVLLAEHGVRADPPPVTLESLRQSDPTNLPAYTLRVRLEERAGGLPGQGRGWYACVLTRGAPGFAASCKAEQLPKAVYYPTDPPSGYRPIGYTSLDYDSEGNLCVWMRAKWVTLSTATINESYDEGRTFFVSPQDVVVKTGVSRRLDRYAPDDLSGWALSKLRRVWWALGQGLSGNFERILRRSDDGGLLRISVHSKRGRGAGVWHTAYQMQPSPIIREASWIWDARSDVSVHVTTKGARQFGAMTLAEEGVVRFPFPQENPIETRVILKDFEPRFHEGLFKQVQETLEKVRADESVKVLDYPWGPPTPPPVTTHP